MKHCATYEFVLLGGITVCVSLNQRIDRISGLFSDNGRYFVRLLVSSITRKYLASFSLPALSVYLHFVTFYVRNHRYSFLSYRNRCPRLNHGNRFKTALCFYYFTELSFVCFCFFPSKEHFIRLALNTGLALPLHKLFPPSFCFFSPIHFLVTLRCSRFLLVLKIFGRVFMFMLIFTFICVYTTAKKPLPCCT